VRRSSTLHPPASGAADRCTFYASRDQLDQIDWPAVAATQWSSPDIREGKQAEFLLHNFFPWQRIGTHSQPAADQAVQMIVAAAHQPTVARQPS